MKPNIGIANKNLQEVANILNTLLADEVVLYIKTRNYHWNIVSPSFLELHKFFEEQYNELDELMDSVAERTRNLGHYALGTLKAFSKATRLTEGQDEGSPEKMIKNLLDDHETIIREIRNVLKSVSDKYDDAGSNDFLTGVMKQHEKMAWMLRSYLK
jgi:starvation-inducible DNA-binding protein